MITLRSILFNTAFYTNMILRMILLSPFYFLAPRKTAFGVPKGWARSSHWLMKTIVGTTFTVEGLENIPKSGGYILAPKHQSFWETFAILPLLDDPATHPEASPQREAVLAALNGVLGDHLAASHNPLRASTLQEPGAVPSEGLPS